MRLQTLAPARGQRGFTLVELLIVVAIVGILATVAYNNWRNQVVRSNRTEGTSFLADAAARQERFFTNCSTYTTVIVGPGGCTGCACGLNYSQATSSNNGFYLLTAGAGPTGNIATSYTLTATAQGGQAADDAACTPLTLDSQGTRGPNPDCW